MKRIILVLLLLLTFAKPAHADWRWAAPPPKKITVGMVCAKPDGCLKALKRQARHEKRKYVKRYNAKKLREWKRVISVPVPRCIWYGESGVGPEFARYRYTLPNSTGSGAYGKYQFMSSTYHNNARYHDWSALDQEIAARGEVRRHGTQPWTNCHY